MKYALVYVVVFACVCCGYVCGAEEGSKFFVINEDNDHYFKQDASLMTKRALENYIDSFADTGVTHFFMCPNGQRTSYRTSVWEAIWDDVDGKPPTDIWALNAKKLFDDGIDPYSVWIARCRERGISPWLTMRMNDVHFVTTKGYFRNMNYWRANPQLWRVPNGAGGTWTDYAFDYSKPEVQKYSLALVRELLERYDVDGLELDWMRFCLHLTPGKSFEQRGVLTDFVRRVREIADEIGRKRGRRIGICARVPAEPDVGAWLGMDAVEWAKEGLVDMLVPSCFFSSADFDMEARSWRKAGVKIPLLPALDNGVCGSRRLRRIIMDRAMYNGWIANMRYGGFSDGLYFFNLVYSPKLFAELVRADISDSALERLPRRHVLSFRDYMESPEASRRMERLPEKISSRAEFAIQCGKVPPSGEVSAHVDFRDSPDFEKSVFEASLNGGKPVRAEPAAPVGKGRRGARFRFEPGSARDGVNSLKISLVSGAPQTVEWAEIDFNLK